MYATRHTTFTDPILPGSTIGIIGGGAFGRMTALAARALGYRVHVLDADPSCTSAGIADLSVPARLTDVAAALAVARGCDVITTSVEEVPAATLGAVMRHAPLRPGLELVTIAQERAQERRWLEARGVNVGPWRAADTRDEIARAVAELDGPCYVKPRVRRAGDRGPIFVSGAGEVGAAWIALRGRPCVVERALAVDVEISVAVARSVAGEIRSYPAAMSWREHTRLVWSVVPGPMRPALARKAEELASYIAARLQLEGLLTVEMFGLADGTLVVNELVPCPHPTMLASDRSCGTGQFEQHVRAITGLPLGSAEVVRASASAVLSAPGGEGGRGLRFHEALRLPEVQLHLYDAPRDGRAMGHLSAAGDTPDEAVRRALDATARLHSDRTSRTIARRRLDAWRRVAAGAVR